ncbi:hypothetical protein PG985_006489 [Apiospora marii]|uniref:Uncharacterized protein n=1 Tax=Apiospora marii TaxID=335849 RepID=A0ABR1S7S1_9PEZI
MPPRVITRPEELHQHETGWFIDQALRCIQMTNPDAVKADLGQGGKYFILLTFWYSKVFNNGERPALRGLQ